jgi:hypothetical protein
MMICLVMAAAFAGSGVATCAYHLSSSLRPPAASETTSVLHETSSVVTAVRDLARLEAVSFHMERVIDLRDRQSHLFGLVSSEDALLLVAAADVVAGVDLAGLRDGDITIEPDRKAVQLSLPPPILLSARLDNARTYVHSRSTGALARRAESLETRARQEAERSLQQAALDAGILLRARENVARTLRTLLQSLGYKKIELSFREE